MHSTILLAISLCASASVIKHASYNQLAVGPCIKEQCPRGYMCKEEECLPDMTKLELLGPCVNNLCPKSYTCSNDMCLRPTQKIVEGSTAIGPCVNERCPERHMCQKSDYQCYPVEE